MISEWGLRTSPKSKVCFHLQRGPILTTLSLPEWQGRRIIAGRLWTKTQFTEPIKVACTDVDMVVKPGAVIAMYDIVEEVHTTVRAAKQGEKTCTLQFVSTSCSRSTTWKDQERKDGQTAGVRTSFS